MVDEKELKQALKTIIDSVETDIPAIYEKRFKEKYLDILTSKDSNVDVSPWLDVAGNMFTPVDVYDNNGKEILFRVPPLVRQTKTKMHSSRNSVFEMLSTHSKKLDRNPNLGISYFKEQSRLRVLQTELNEDDLGNWVKILKYYGLYDDILPENVTIDPKDDKVTTDLFDGGFDEF